MSNKPGRSSDSLMRLRSLGIALGVTEYLFIVGIFLLATGCVLVFGFGVALMVIGSVILATAFYNAQVG